MRELIEYLQNPHSIDVLAALTLIHSAEGNIGWRDAKQHFKKEGVVVSDNTYRKRCSELVELGLAEPIPLDPLKNRYKLTDKGKKVAETLIKTLISLSKVMQSGKTRGAKED